MDNPIFLLNDKAYNTLKWFVQIVLPACATLYFALAGLWGFPHGEDVVGTIAAVTTFLGVILGVSTHAYNTSDRKYDGTINTTTNLDEEGNARTVYSLDLNDAPERMSAKNEVTFKVN